MRHLIQDIDIWFPYSRELKDFRIICFAHAGASASIFRSWQQNVDPQIALWPIQLPARETRYRHSPVTDLNELLDAIIRVAMPLFADGRFAFFGHSFGARLGFELAHRLLIKNLPSPCCLFVSGRSAPQFEPRTKGLHLKPDQEFLAAIKQYGGTPPELAENIDLLACYTNVLRMDFKLDEAAFHFQKSLSCPIFGFFGTDDPLVDEPGRNGWAQLTKADYKQHIFAGNHFYYHDYLHQLLGIVCREVNRHAFLANVY